jgi:uncharacterized membrane protein
MYVKLFFQGIKFLEFAFWKGRSEEWVFFNMPLLTVMPKISFVLVLYCCVWLQAYRLVQIKM